MTALALHQILDKAAQSRRLHRLTDAHLESTHAVSLARKQGSQYDLIRALRLLGQIERDDRRPERALPHYQEAVELCRTEADALALAHTSRHMGDLLVELNRLPDAATWYEEALTIYRAQPNTSVLDLANALRAIAALKQRAGEAQAARGLWAEARGLYSSASVNEGVAECDTELANLNNDGS